MRTKSIVTPLILIVLGIFFLLSNFGMMPHLGALFSRWWPLILIAVGIYLFVQRRG